MSANQGPKKTRRRRSGTNLAVIGTAQSALEDLGIADGAVRLCYIDPPFNTGERRFTHYDDAMSADGWMDMMSASIEAIRPLLSPTGSLWLHLDDNHQHHGRMILDEVFSPQSFVSTVIWQKRLTRDNRKAFSSAHDYLHVYSPAGPDWKRWRNPLPDTGGFWNPDNDPRGPWRSVPLSAPAGHATAAQFYTVETPTGLRHDPPAGRCWTYSKPRLLELVQQGLVYWPRNGDGKPRLKRFQSEVEGITPFTIWSAAEVGDNASAKKDLMKLFPEQARVFSTPKPEGLLQRVIEISTDPGDLVLDTFLGSGTTAVVAQRLGRNWIGVEKNPETMLQIAVPRIELEEAASSARATIDVVWAPEDQEGLSA